MCSRWNCSIRRSPTQPYCPTDADPLDAAVIGLRQMSAFSVWPAKRIDQPVAQTRKRLAWRDRVLWKSDAPKSALVIAMQSSGSGYSQSLDLAI